MSIAIFFLVAALVLFLLAGFGVNGGRFNLVALGLACFVLAGMVGTTSLG